MVIWHLKQIGKVKSPMHGYLMNWLQIKKKSFWSVCWLLLFYITTNHLSISNSQGLLLDWVQWLDWEKAPKHFPKANLHQNSLDHCLVVCCQSGTVQLSESQQNRHLWGVCSAHRWSAPKAAAPEAGVGQQKGPNLGFLGGSAVNNLPAMQEPWVWSLGWEDPLEESMATHSSILAWTEEPGGLHPWGHKESDRLSD